MSYESDQIQYQKELEQIKDRLEILDKYFVIHPYEKKKDFARNEYLGDYDCTRIQYEQILQRKYNDFDTCGWSVCYLEYKICLHRKYELEYKLKESKSHRNISKTINFLESITPQHVSGRVYKVENGDGCSMFCLWFVIIDAIIFFIIFLFLG